MDGNLLRKRLFGCDKRENMLPVSSIVIISRRARISHVARVFSVQRVQPVSRVREGRHDPLSHASLPAGVRVQRALVHGRCSGHSVQRRPDTASGSVVEALARNHKRRALPDRRGGAEVPGVCEGLRVPAVQEEHRLSRRVQGRGAIYFRLLLNVRADSRARLAGLAFA